MGMIARPGHSEFPHAPLQDMALEMASETPPMLPKTAPIFVLRQQSAIHCRIFKETGETKEQALSGRTVIIPDVTTDSRFQYQKAAKREGIVSVLCVPLEVRGKAIGVLRVYTSAKCIFHEDDSQFLSVLASLAALAIENANLYESLKSSYDGVMDVLWGTSLTYK